MKKIILLLLAVVFMTGCKKEAGTGGTSTITGKIIVRDYNGLFPVLYNEYPSQEDDVYIIYGDAAGGFSDRTKTSHDGTYRFDYLRKGDYTVFIYTDDTMTFTNPDKVVLEYVTIGKNKSDVTVPEMLKIKL